MSIHSDKHPHSARVKALLEAAKEEMRDKQPLEGDLVMEVEYGGLYFMADPVNVVFALPNIFEGIIYKDDNQIREVHCHEKKSDEPTCTIRFRNC